MFQIYSLKAVDGFAKPVAFCSENRAIEVFCFSLRSSFSHGMAVFLNCSAFQVRGFYFNMKL